MKCTFVHSSTTRPSGFSVTHFLPLLLSLILTACGGDYSGTDDNSESRSASPTDNTSTDSSTPGENTDPAAAASTLEAFFVARIEPHMGYCGTCHTPGSIADTDEGRGFLLQPDISHYASFQLAWETLGKGVVDNGLLKENADMAEPHTGGKTWPANSQINTDVATLLLCWNEPTQCPLTADDDDNDGGGDDDDDDGNSGEDPDDDDTGGNDGNTGNNNLPLLGSSHANHLWNQFCATADADALLPADPRSLIVPDVNKNRAVYFNAYYQDCHVNLPEEEQRPKTCGEYLARVERGDYFANQRAAMTDLSISASSINNLWKRWGLKQRPDNFDQLLTERYGFNPAPYPNPYPLPGEDPVASNGGSGQLPMGLIQARDSSGNYNGKVSMNCYICHGGQIGSEEDGEGLGPIPGMGNTNTDMMVFMRDISGGLVGGLLPFGLNNVRGTSNAVGAFDLLTMIWDVDTLSLSPNPIKLPFSHSYHGNQDMPNWWNSSHRPRKFFDGGVSMDSTRIDMAAADQVNLLRSGAVRRAATELYDQDLQAYVDSRTSPPFPNEIDTALAEQGAIIFHNKNLWANGANANLPHPQGNGSCAGCHGAYSPRYVNDPAFLENPVLEGVAGYIVPLDLIMTDPARALSITAQVRAVFKSSWWGYPDGMPGYIPPGEKSGWDEYRDDMAWPIVNPEGRPVDGACGWAEDFGYLAPPLYGVWASSPYLHNGSIPTLRQVLRSSERPTIWARQDSPVAGKVKGFDMSLNAYDLDENVGWKYREYCSRQDSSPEECNGPDRVRTGLFYRWLDSIKDNFWLAGFISKPYGTQKQIDQRKIFNTHEFSNSNAGHTFTDVLTEAETRAVIEYLKTL